MNPSQNSMWQSNQPGYFTSNSNPQRSQSAPLPYKFGSTREEFQQFRMDYIKKDANEDYSYSSSLCQQRAYEKMNNIMLRIEDYYLIRTGQVEGSHRRNLEAAVQNQNFPTSLVQNQQNLNCPVFFPEKARSQWNSQGSNYTFSNNNWQSNNRLNNNMPSNNGPNNNMFSSQNQSNTNNLFLSKTPTPSSNNVFSQNTSNNMFNSTNNNNMFNQQRPAGNMFSPQPQQNMFQSSTQNLFQQPNTQAPLVQPNLFQQQPVNMFNQTPSLFPMTNNNLFAQNNNMFQQNRIPTYLQPQPMLNQYGQQPQWGYGQFQQPLMLMNPYMNPMQLPKMDDQTITTTISFLQQELERNQAQREQEKLEQDKLYDQLIQAAQQQQQKMEENDRRIQRQMAITARNSRPISPIIQVPRIKSRSPSPLNRSQKFPIQSRVSNISRSNIQSNIFPRSPGRMTDSKHSDARPVISSINYIVISLQSGKVYEQTLIVKISNDSTIAKLKLKILDQLKNEYNLIPKEHSIDNYFNYSTIKIGSDKVIHDDQTLSALPKEINIQFELSSCPMVPQTKLKCFPDLKQLSRMNLYQLQNVENFEIWNDHGKIIWQGKSDISYQNFDEILKIHPMEVDMYDVEFLGEFIKPDMGQKLNKQCEVIFKFPEHFIKDYDLLETPENHEKIYQQLQNIATNQNLQMIEYNQENFTYRVQIDHFTKYSFKLAANPQFQEQPNQTEDSRFIENQIQRYPKRPTFQEEEEIIEEEDHKESFQNEQELEEIRLEVFRLRGFINKDLIASQIKQPLPLITPLNERVMKFNLRIFNEDENKCETSIYLTQVAGASYTNQGQLMKFCPGKIEIYSQNQDRDDDIIYMLDVLSKGPKDENEISTILYEFLQMKFSTQHEQEDIEWYLSRLEILNILMGNPAININKEQLHLYDINQIKGNIDSIRRYLLQTQLEKMYWNSHLNQKQFGDYRLYKIAKLEGDLTEDPLNKVLLTSQNAKIFVGNKFHQEENLPLETQWIASLLENVISHQDDQTFFKSLIQYIKKNLDQSITALIITTFLTFLTEDISLFYSSLEIIEKVFTNGDLRSRTVALVVFYFISTKKTTPDQKKALRFVTRNISSSLQHQVNGITSQSIVLFQNIMSKNISNNINHQQEIQKQAAEKFLSLRCLKVLPEEQAAESIILYHLQKKQFAQALEIASKYNYSSYYVQILTQFYLPTLIIYQIQNDGSGLDEFKQEIFEQLNQLKWHKKRIESLKKNSRTMENVWWQNVGKLIKKLSLLPFHSSYKDKVAMEILKQEIVDWLPQNIYQTELKEQCIQFIDLRLP